MRIAQITTKPRIYQVKDKTSLVFDSEAKDIRYPEFEDVVKALQTDELSGLGVYEITWIKS